MPKVGQTPPTHEQNGQNQQNKVSNKIIENPQNPKNKGGRPSQEYGLNYLNKSQHSDKQVEHFRYFEKADKNFLHGLRTVSLSMILLNIKTLLQLHKNMELQMVVMPQEMSTTLRLTWQKNLLC